MTKINGITAARAFLIDYMKANFADKTFANYVQNELAGDFAFHLARTLAAAHPDTERLDALAANYWKLDPFNMPTGGDDADVGWRVIQYHMGKPQERTVAEVYRDDMRAAIDAAMKTE